jgi:putative transposase
MLTSIKYRCYPNETQAKLLAQQFGNARFVWNQLLVAQKERLEKGERLLSQYDMMALISGFVAQYPFLGLSKVDALRGSAVALDAGIQKWRKKQGCFPRFKKKGYQGAITTVQPGKGHDGQVFFSRSLRLRVVEHKSVDGDLKRLTISKTPSGRYYASCLYETAGLLPPLLGVKGVIGIDDGLETFVTLSTGRKIKHGKHLKRNMANLARQQRFLARKKKGSHRREKQRVRVAKVHEKVKNARSYETHLITTNLVRKAVCESQAIAYQKSAIAGMMKNHCLAMAISDAGWGALRTQLEYKCKLAGVPLFVVDKWQPTSKVCSVCGHKLESLPLSVRKWKCPECGFNHDRDTNAAQVIANIARKEIPCLHAEEGTSMSIEFASAQVRPMKREGQEHAHKRVEARK